MKQNQNNTSHRLPEASFTLIETVMALGLMAFLIIQISTVQGNSITFTDYGRNATQASWLAKRILSQVEYNWATRPFKELETSVRDRPFEEFPEYTWSLDVKEWKLPLTEILASGGPASAEEENASAAEDKQDSMAQMIQTGLDQALGGEPALMTAHVEVSWAEGAHRNSSGATLLLTNQKKFDEVMLQLKPIWDNLTKPKKNENKNKKNNRSRTSSEEDSG